MVQSVRSWKPDKELPVKSKECKHEWSENMVTNYTICYFCGILTTDTSRLNCPKCQLTTCTLCARNYLGKTVNVKRKQPQKQEEEKDFNSNEVKLLKELLKEKTEQVQQMIRDQAKEYYENKAAMQKKEEIWQSKESLLVRDLTDALKIIDQLRLKKERLEEQKDEEIRELKAQLQKKKEEEEVQFSKEDFWNHRNNRHRSISMDHLTTTGITAIPGERRSIEELEGMSWHLKPPEQTSVCVPSRVAVNERLNRSVSLRFERYRQTPQPPRYSVDQHDREVIRNDNLDEDEEHFIGICLQTPQEEHISYDVCFCENCLNEARILEEEPLNKVRRSNKPKRSRQRSWERWSTLGEPSGKWDYYVKYDAPPDTTPIEEIAATGWGDEFSDDEVTPGKVTILEERSDWDDDERSGGKVLVIQERLAQNQQEFLDEYLPQWDEHLAIQKQELESEWENPFAAKRGENHTILHLSKEEENDDLPYPKFRNFKQVAAQIIKKHKEQAFPSTSQEESTQNYQPPHDSIMGPSVYPSAQQNLQPFKRKYKDDRGRVKKCKCFICGKEGHFVKDCRSKQGNIARSAVYQELDLDDNWDIVSADFDDSSVYSISEGEGDTHQSISVMVQDTPVEETVFMAIKEDDEIDSEEEDNQSSDYAFMFHPGPPTKIAEMVQAVGSWKPNKELPAKSKECEHEWKENTVTNYTICYYCGILTTDISRLNCPKCQLTTCALCARNYLDKTVNVKRKQPQKSEEEKDFNSNEVKLLKELLKEKSEQVQQMIRDQAKEYYENKAAMQKKEEIWQSKESLLVRDLTDALKIIDQLRIEKERLEEQKHEEIRKLKLS
ncbi:Orf y [Tanacetum coccineum]